MKTSNKCKLAALMSAATAIALCGCNQEIAVVLDSPAPWRDGSGSYEKLVYEVTIYDGGSDEERKTLAQGSLSFELTEGKKEGDAYESGTIDMSYSVTYTQDAAEAERGLTDTVTSSVTYMADSLHVNKSEKTVSLAKREGVLDLSYTVTADYMTGHKATVTMTGYDEPTSADITIPSGIFYDNEMFYYLARSTQLAAGSSPNFKMVNLFDSYNKGKFTNYNMLASVKSDLAKIDVGDWVKDFGVEAVTDEETGKTSYPVSCFDTAIYINDSKHGPEHCVYYTEKPFVSGGKTHNKIPVLMHYSEYSVNVLTRYTEYKLTSCSFVKGQE